MRIQNISHPYQALGHITPLLRQVGDNPHQNQRLIAHIRFQVSTIIEHIHRPPICLEKNPQEGCYTEATMFELLGIGVHRDANDLKIQEYFRDPQHIQTLAIRVLDRYQKDHARYRGELRETLSLETLSDRERQEVIVIADMIRADIRERYGWNI